MIECLTVLQPDPHFPETPGRNNSVTEAGQY